jgi:lysophospholipase L1-like esterase
VTDSVVALGPLPAKSRWRIAVLGNSLPILMVPPRRDRREGAYPELLERELVARGHDAVVDCHARLYDLAHEGERRWTRDVAPSAPDVLVLNYGILEAQPNVLPTVLNRHLTRNDTGGPGLRGAWVRHAIPRLWPLARRYQRWAASIVGDRTWRLHPDRLRASLAQIISVATAGGTLVLVVDVLPPGGRLRHFVPGIEGRVERVNATLRSLVADAGCADVRLVEASAIALQLGPAGVPDGLHLVAEGHRRVALALADEIGPWLARQR